jgi:hypothetical protein
MCCGAIAWVVIIFFIFIALGLLIAGICALDALFNNSSSSSSSENKTLS